MNKQVTQKTMGTRQRMKTSEVEIKVENSKMDNTDPAKNRRWIKVVAKDIQFLFLIRHRPCYLHIYVQLEQVNVGYIIRLTCLCVALLLLYSDCCSTCFGQLVKFIYSILNRSFTNGLTEEISSTTEIDQSSSKTFWPYAKI